VVCDDISLHSFDLVVVNWVPTDTHSSLVPVAIAQNTLCHVDARHCIFKQIDVFLCHFNVGCGDAKLLTAALETMHYFSQELYLRIDRIGAPVRIFCPRFDIQQEFWHSSINFVLRRRFWGPVVQLKTFPVLHSCREAFKFPRSN